MLQACKLKTQLLRKKTAQQPARSIRFIVAAGSFATAGGAPANGIARWNGAAWSGLGTGAGGTVRTLLVAPSGDLIAAGSFSTAGGQPAANVARRNPE